VTEETSAQVETLPPLIWRSQYLKTSLSSVPPKPGLYAFGWDEKSHLGLNAQRRYVYIGQTDNLKRRLMQHQLKSEKNLKLRKFLLEHRKLVRCWYCRLPKNFSSLTSRLKLEKELIQFFTPEINIQQNLQGERNDR